MLTSNVLDLVGLLAYNVRGTGELCVDRFLVVQVDEGRQVEDGCTEKRQPPEWQELDQEIRDE